MSKIRITGKLVGDLKYINQQQDNYVETKQIAYATIEIDDKLRSKIIDIIFNDITDLYKLTDKILFSLSDQSKQEDEKAVEKIIKESAKWIRDRTPKRVEVPEEFTEAEVNSVLFSDTFSRRSINKLIRKVKELDGRVG